jgi:hypothetical protein
VPTLRDLYQYIEGEANVSPGMLPGMEAGGGSYAEGLTWTPQNTGADGNMQEQSITFSPDPLFASGVTYNPGNAEGGANGFSVDPSKFPQTRFGDVTRTMRVTQDMKPSEFYDPRLVYNDPNYGPITSSANLKPDQVNTIAPQAIMAALMAGMGGLGMPSWAMSGTSLARGLGSGQGLNVGTLAGMAGGALGLPGWATSLGRLALAQALRNRTGKG